MKRDDDNPRRPAPELPAAPGTIDISEVRRRYRFTIRVAALACAVYVLALSVAGYWWPMGVADAGWVVVLVLLERWTLQPRDGSRLEAGVHLLAATGGALLFMHSWYSGLADSFATWYFAVIPIVVALLGNVRLLVLWTIVAIGLVLAVRLLQMHAPVAPLIIMSPAMVTFTQVMLVLVTTLYSVAALRANAAHLRALHDAYGRLLAQKELLDLQARELSRSLRDAQEARTAADAANKAKSDFLAMMSHEIRTPLNGVIGLNSLLLDMPLDDKARRYAELGRQSGETLLVLVNDFLDFSRMEAGHLELEQVPFVPRQVIEETMALIDESAQRKGLRLVADIEAPELLSGDPARLRQILTNLLGNAVKFTPRGEVRLVCRPLKNGNRHAWLRIEVRDTGIGIEPDALTRLFQPFTQADASTTRRYGGTGLGLAICRALALRMGGRIGVDSRSGAGSTFWLELPFERPGDAHAAGSSLAGAPAHQQFRGRVLVAEDNPVNQIVARDMLARFGLTVDIASDGEQAVHAAGARDYDLVFMDCEMPGVDGFEATRLIRGLAGPRHAVRIIAMTAGVLAGNEERCRAAGMDDFVAKPLRLGDLEQTLSRHFQPVGN